jgi:hypothetical protein|tara:strand:- start:1252 stop:1911 length:660 start_codon:yes stop_codon:yes gene_type:complete
MLNFEKNKHDVLRKVLNPDYCNLFAEYFRNKSQTYETMLKHTFVSEYHDEFGTKFDRQVPGAYSCYGDIMMDMLLVNMHNLMEKSTGLRLQPNYSYARIYKTGHDLKKHKDRLSCEISTTLNLGGDPWPLYVEPDSRLGVFNSQQDYIESNSSGVRINLNPGDMLIYRGCDLEHWREKFEGKECVQVFLHYNDVSNREGRIYDGRPHLGLPTWFKKRNG